MAVIVANKPLGWTPLQVIENIREKDSRYSDSKMVYAGRLDPMAEGLLVILTDEDRFKLDGYLKKEKSYTATMLFGFKSDSLDALGIVERVGSSDLELAVGAVEGLVGAHELELPSYSAYKIQGKPLHWWAQQGRIDEIEKPKKNMTVQDVRVVKTEMLNAGDVLLDVERTISLVSGDFRQDEAVESWKRALDGVDELLVVTAEFDVTSGTYIRTLVDTVGEKLGCGGLLLHLDRTRLGEFVEPT
ncbi:hypothetical protein HOI83_02345 [Candidatus Uhrbacteria bacterium]|jgi:tRNA pseudouridine(55) synthase|nr:hypothetical protein [Candidatus Uhrbacteria bacterium]